MYLKKLTENIIKQKMQGLRSCDCDNVICNFITNPGANILRTFGFRNSIRIEAPKRHTHRPVTSDPSKGFEKISAISPPFAAKTGSLP